MKIKGGKRKRKERDEEKTKREDIEVREWQKEHFVNGWCNITLVDVGLDRR